MKKTVKIVGIEHKSGTSNRTGNPYDFYVMHGTYTNPETEGIATFSAPIPDHSAEMAVIGNEVLVLSHFYNGKETIDAIFPA